MAGWCSALHEERARVMETPHLRGILKVIIANSKYDSIEKIATRIGKNERTLRGYCEDGKVPDRSVGMFSDLVVEISGLPMSRDTAKQLLNGSPRDMSDLLRSESLTWLQFLATSEGHVGLFERVLETRLVQLTGVGQDDSLPSVKRGEEFYCSTGMSWSLGEGLLVAQFQGSWHILDLAGTGSRILKLQRQSDGSVRFPGRTNRIDHFFCEYDGTGSYRFVFILVSGRFDDAVRSQIRGTNPLSDTKLNQLADLFSRIDKEKRALRVLDFYVN